MIANDKNKLIMLWILVLIFFSAVAYQWWQMKPFAVTVSSSDDTGQQIGSRVSQALQSIAANFELARQQAVSLPDELARQNQQQVLLKKAREYITNYNQTQASSTEAQKE